jgi:hypothetical protein
MNPKPILIYDTTLRDGSQGEGVSFSLQDKLNIASRLAELGIDFIEGGYPPPWPWLPFPVPRLAVTVLRDSPPFHDPT